MQQKSKAILFSEKHQGIQRSLLLTSSPDFPSAAWVKEGKERDRLWEAAFLEESHWHTEAQRWAQRCTRKVTGDWDVVPSK